MRSPAQAASTATPGICGRPWSSGWSVSSRRIRLAGLPSFRLCPRVVDLGASLRRCHDLEMTGLVQRALDPLVGLAEGVAQRPAHTLAAKNLPVPPDDTPHGLPHHL